jgi:hypothetical protein
MSKSWFYLGIISSLAILTSSCGGDSDKKPAATAPAPATSPAPAAAPTAPTSTAAVPAPTTSPNPATPATTPGAASIKPISPDVAAGLIPSTEPEIWSRTVAKGRPDPFAVLALQPVEIAIENTNPQAAPVKTSSDTTAKKSQSITPIATKSNTKIATNSSEIQSSAPAIKSGVDKPLPKMKISAKLPSTSTTSGNPKIANTSSTPKANSSIREDKLPISAIPRSGINRSLPKITVALSATKSTQSTVTPKSESKNQIRVAKSIKPTSSKKSIVEAPAKTQIATKPELVVAKPLQAMAIEISGMIDVAGKTQVIIKLPTESFSRYVEVGERILNGKVLVKRVEGQNSLSPTVVLEEVGMEVSRKIGDKSTPASPESAPKP